MSQPTPGRIRYNTERRRRERATENTRRRSEVLRDPSAPRARSQAIADRIQQTRKEREDVQAYELYNNFIAQYQQAEFDQAHGRPSGSRGQHVEIVEDDSGDDPTYQVENEGSSEMRDYDDEFTTSAVQEETHENEPDREAETYFIEALMSRSFKGTRYPHRPTMGALGIMRDITQLLTLTGMQKLQTTLCDGYREETCHFLATLALHFDDDEMQGYITFSVRGEEYELSIMEMNGVYGFPYNGNTDATPEYDSNELNSLWKTIGVGVYEAGKSKCSGIRNPALRYFHKVIANTLFAKETTGNITEGELGLIATALKPMMHYTTEGYPMQGDLANTSMARILLENLLSYRGWAASNYNRNIKGTLVVGGIVTPILRACNVPLQGKGVAARAIDLGYLRNAHFFSGSISDQKYQFSHPEFGTSLFLLPNEDLTTISMGVNIDFQPPRETLFSYKGKEKVAEPMEVAQDEEPPTTQVADELDEPSCYYFEESPKSRQGKSAVAAHAKLKKVQRWNKFQDNFFTKKFKEMTSQIKKLTLKIDKITSSKKQSQPERPERSQSFRESPQRPEPQQQHRHSSVDPATIQRRKRHHRDSQGSSSQSLMQQQQEMEQQWSYNLE